LVYAAIMALWTPWRLHTRQGFALKLWFWVVPTLGLWAAMTQAGSPVLWFGVAFVEGQLAVLWAGQLASRARLFRLLDGVPEGPQLEEKFRDLQLDANFSRGNHAALSSSLVVMAVLAVGFAAVSRVPGPGTGIVLAVFLTGCQLLGVLLRLYRREMSALIYGHRFNWTDKLAPLGWSLLLAGLAAAGAWALLCLGGPWLDFSNLVPNSGQLSVPEVPATPARPLDTGHTGDPRLLVLLTLLALIFRLQRIGQVVTALIQFALWCLPWAVVAFLLWPVVRWVLGGGRETRGLLRRWKRLLRAQVAAFVRTLRAWWDGASPGPAGTLVRGTGARDWFESLRGQPSRRRPYPAVVNAFLSIVRWAEPFIAYRQGETTREFLDRLAAAVPNRASELALVRDGLDQELFGPQGLDPGQRQKFLRLAARVTSPSHDPAGRVS
jgi:hypothetical protein